MFLIAFFRFPVMPFFHNQRLFSGVLLWAVLIAAPAYAETGGAGLVDKLLSILGNKNLPRINVPPPPAPQAVPSLPQQAAPGAGPEIARNFLPVYALDRDVDDNPPVLPFFASGPLDRVYRGVTSLVIMLHDKDGEAARAFAYARSAQDEAAARFPEWDAGDAYLFAPQFLSASMLATRAQDWPDGGEALLRWASDGWRMGEDSAGSLNEQGGAQASWMQRRGLSSFSVMDFMLLTLARPKIFPDLKRVVIAGTGAGGDFVQRYAVLGVSPAILEEEGIEVRFVPALANSFLYLDAQRAPVKPAGEYKADDPPAFGAMKEGACAPANTYPFGLEAMLAYGRKQGEAGLRLRYGERKVLYLVGDGATLPLKDTTPEACALDVQGGTLKSRTMIYAAHIQKLYGPDVECSQRLLLASKVNEDALTLWRSRCGMAALFGDGWCDDKDKTP